MWLVWHLADRVVIRLCCFKVNAYVFDKFINKFQLFYVKEDFVATLLRLYSCLATAAKEKNCM